MASPPAASLPNPPSSTPSPTAQPCPPRQAPEPPKSSPPEALPPEKMLSKLKRFLTTIHQFASNISSELGDSVKTLILDLVAQKLTADEFFKEMQSEIPRSNFPFRPSVVPFLNESLPLLRSELAASSKLIAQSLLFATPDNASSDPTSNVPLPSTQSSRSLSDDPSSTSNGPVATSTQSPIRPICRIRSPVFPVQPISKLMKKPPLITTNHLPASDNNCSSETNLHNSTSDSLTNRSRLPGVLEKLSSSQRRRSSERTKGDVNQNRVSTTSMAVPPSLHRPISISVNGQLTRTITTSVDSASSLSATFTRRISSPIRKRKASFLVTPHDPMANQLASPKQPNLGQGIPQHPSISNISPTIKSSIDSLLSAFTNPHTSPIIMPPLGSEVMSGNGIYTAPVCSTTPSSNGLHSQIINSLNEEINRYFMNGTNGNNTSGSSNGIGRPTSSATASIGGNLGVLPPPGAMTSPLIYNAEWDIYAKEWKSIENLFTTMMSSMEQLRYALVLFQHRVRLSHIWNGQLRPSPAAADQASAERIEEVKRKADEAIQKVKLQAMSDMHKAVGLAEQKALESLGAQRADMERALRETQRTLVVQEDRIENCWNCGRRANQTCSGCQLARYCGQFCQHKDWTRHRFNCGASQAQTFANQQSILSPKPKPSADQLDKCAQFKFSEDSKLNELTVDSAATIDPVRPNSTSIQGQRPVGDDPHDQLTETSSIPDLSQMTPNSNGNSSSISGSIEHNDDATSEPALTRRKRGSPELDSKMGYVFARSPHNQRKFELIANSEVDQSNHRRDDENDVLPVQVEPARYSEFAVENGIAVKTEILGLEDSEEEINDEEGTKAFNKIVLQRCILNSEDGRADARLGCKSV